MASTETVRNLNSTPNTSEIADNAFPHEVAGLKTLRVDRDLADENITFYTDQVEMDDGIRYIVTTNTVESVQERAKDLENKQYPGADILAVENTAWTTKNGGFYKKRHVEQARRFHRPSMIIGVQQNLDRYSTFSRTINDTLAIYAFMAAT